MKNILIVFSFLLLATTVFSQKSDTVVVGENTIVYTYHISPGDSLRESGNIKAAIEYYKSQGLKPGDDFSELYNYAAALSIDYQIDSAFKYLQFAMLQDTSPAPFCNPDFLNLRKGKLWDGFETNLIALIQKKFNTPYKDVDYAKRLWYMEATDQAYYDCINLADSKTGKNSTVVRALWTLKEKLNDENQKELVQLIETKGWPKKSVVGQRASGAAFLVIQHSDADKQKKYLPIIEKLCKESEASWESYALMYDRIQTSDNKPQKYGSQVRYNAQTNTYELFPLLDETKVDEWRKEVGLGSLAEYVANWNIKFEPKKK